MNGVLYMLQGDKHAAQLVVSIYSLRQHYDGPICIATGDRKATKIAEQIFFDKRLRIHAVKPWQAATRRSTGKNGTAYANKCQMYRLSPFDKTIFLDADTLIVNPIDDLWPLDREVRLTWFSDWVTTGNLIGGRIRGWKDICPVEYVQMSQQPYPAINTGVMSFSKASKDFMDDWLATTQKNICFICDEIAAQLIFIRHLHTVMTDEWNFSPQYSKPIDSEGVEKKIRIYHYHGKQHCKPDKSDGYKTWFPVYQECVEKNIANICEWTPAGDKRLRNFLEQER